MTQLYLSLTSLLLLTRDRLQQRLRDDRDDEGLATLELVILAVGLFTIATLVIVAITTFVQDKVNEIG